MIFTCLNNEVNVELQIVAEILVLGLLAVPEMATMLFKSDGLLTQSGISLFDLHIFYVFPVAYLSSYCSLRTGFI